MPPIQRKDLAQDKKEKTKAKAEAAAGASKDAQKQGKGSVAAVAGSAAAAGEDKQPQQQKSKKEKKAGNEDAAAAAGAPKKEKKAKQGGVGGGGAAAEPVANSPAMIDLRVGKIVEIGKHPDADSLYLEKVDFGEPEGPRQVISGLVKFVPIEEMRDRWVVGVCNLKPASMRGVKSYAMLLCASSKDHTTVEPCLPPPGSAVGDKVEVEGYEGGTPLEQLNPKKKIFEWYQPSLLTTDAREAAWTGPAPDGSDSRNRLLKTAKGVVTAPTLVGASLS